MESENTVVNGMIGIVFLVIILITFVIIFYSISGGTKSSTSGGGSYSPPPSSLTTSTSPTPPPAVPFDLSSVKGIVAPTLTSLYVKDSDIPDSNLGLKLKVVEYSQRNSSNEAYSNTSITLDSYRRGVLVSNVTGLKPDTIYKAQIITNDLNILKDFYFSTFYPQINFYVRHAGGGGAIHNQIVDVVTNGLVNGELVECYIMEYGKDTPVYKFYSTTDYSKIQSNNLDMNLALVPAVNAINGKNFNIKFQIYRNNNLVYIFETTPIQLLLYVD
jgi:hypothetical protein